jgi:hypothetical protein
MSEDPQLILVFLLMLRQPFLTPVPPIGSGVLAKVAIPFGYIIGASRAVLVLALGLLYVTLVRGVCLAFVSLVLHLKSASPHVTRFLCHHYTN